MARFSALIFVLVFFLGGCDLFKDDDSREAHLSTLSISDGTLNPGFESGTFNYSAVVDASTDSILVTTTPVHSGATASVNGQSGGSAEISLSVGQNVIRVVVVAENGEAQITYTIVVVRPAPTYTIGGSVAGLNGEVTLQNNGADDLLISADGDFAFATPLDDGSDYEVTVLNQPEGQECTVANESGLLDGADVSDVEVTCVDLTFTVGGTLNGLNDSITLQNNGGDDLTLTEDGSFTFATPVDNGADYEVTISSQPTGQECTITNSSGTIDSANVTNVIVNCGVVPIKLVAGIVSGLVGTVELQLNGTSDMLLVRNGVYNFRDQFQGGEAYDIQIVSQPDNQTCTVSNANGTIGSGHVLDADVDCTGAGNAGGSIFDWEWINPTPQGNPVVDLASDGAQVVAVGSAGFIQTSPDGLNWTTRDSGTSGDFYAVASGNGRFVALGGFGEMYSSLDGITWQAQEIGFKAFNAIAWSGTEFVAVGFGWLDGSTTASLVAKSADGTTWSFNEIGAGVGSLWDVASSGSLLAVLEYPNIVHTSPDSINWTTTTLGDAGTNLVKIASDGSGFVIVDSTGVVFSSPDGAAWTEEAELLPLTYIADLEWDGSRYIGVSIREFVTSADGSTWTVENVSLTANTNFSSVIRHSGQNIIGGWSGHIFTSPDDTSWTTNFSSNISGAFDVIWHDGQFVVVGVGLSIYTSPDGRAWTTRQDRVSQVDWGGSVIWGGDQFLAVAPGSANQVVTSPDGITWTSRTIANADLRLANVAWGNNLYVAVGQNVIVTSSDGVTWTDRSSAVSGNPILHDVVWNGSVWVVTGYDFEDRLGYSWTSPDGVDWTRQSAVSDVAFQYFQSIDWNGSIFVAVGGNGIGTSVDGVNWSILQTNAGLGDVSWSGTEFLLTGYGAEVFASPDGTTWDVTRSISGFNLGGASNGTTTVLVGWSGYDGNIVINDGGGGL